MYYDQALSLNPDYAEAWSNKGNVLHELKQDNEALAHFDKALSLKPDYADTWSNKGVTLYGLNLYEEAIAHYGKALSLKPDMDWIYGDLLHTKMKIADWSGLADSLQNIAKKVMVNERVIQPFPLLALNDDTLLHRQSSEIYTQSKYPLNTTLGPISKRTKSLQNQKIRIAYFSADFRNHAVSFLTAELFELHNKDSLEIIAFSFGADDKSPMRSRLSQAFDQFIDVSHLSDIDIAKLSRELCVDIAVDLGGYTADSRTGIFSYRAAPIQLSYIGYLGTMGAEYFDYLLSDKTIIPEDLQKFYSEKIVYLPNYQVNDRKRVIADRQFTRKELGLPEDGFVFCCFNNNYKILPATFDGWMRILNAVDGSVLFLLADDEQSKSNLINEAKLRGIDRARLVFGGRIPAEEYLARYQVCNLFLDTFPYNAGTTASDALWAGLPVLTLMGQSFASRVAASLLQAIGLPELITSTPEEYEALAIELAKHPQKLIDIKQKLANNRLTTPLFDTPLFTQNMETAYLQMMERYWGDLPVEHLYI
jgi:predicted O-linked N-acetylglucosamine transferase (SPINDLY family)